SLHGACDSPYRFEKVFNYLIDSDLDSLSQAVFQLLHSDKDKLIKAILISLSKRTTIPDLFDEPISRIVNCDCGETRSIALIALSAKPQLAQSLENEVWEALFADEWFVRGNAANVCSSAQLSPDRFLPVLEALATDFEGHDWCPAECAVKAIGQYRSRAKALLPAVEKALAKWLSEEGDESDGFVKYCRDAVASITSFQ
ncbi:MAG: hypothetical protein AAFX40_16285, partial [Cyanobacteria bacterium J06639_1]